jgi:hypothetical protein
MLDRLESLYNEAFGALHQGELDRIGNLVDAVDQLLVDLQDPTHVRNVDARQFAESHTRARTAHGRLVDGMAKTQLAVEDEIGKVRRGRRSLRAYGKRGGPGVGRRVSSRA